MMQFSDRPVARWIGVVDRTGSRVFSSWILRFLPIHERVGVFASLTNSVPSPSARASSCAQHDRDLLPRGAAAASLSGVLISRFGYPPVLTAASLTCVAAALLFRGLRAERIVPSEP